MGKQRLNYVDMLKGLSILCITFLHYEDGVIPSWLNTWIGLFMITAFYFTSGWIVSYKKSTDTIKSLLKKRYKSLIVPYLWFTLLLLAFDVLWYLLGLYPVSVIYRDIYKSITLRGIGTLWFLPALLGGEIIFTYLLNVGKTYLWIIALAVTLCYMSAYNIWLGNYRNINEYYQIADAPFRTLINILRAWPIILFGYLFGKALKNFMNSSKVKIGIIGLALTLISVYFAGFMHVNIGVLGYFLTPVIAPLGLLLLSKSLETQFWTKFFIFWGINSLILMVTHYSILLVICEDINQYIFHQNAFTGLCTIYYFMISLVIEVPIVWLFNHKLKFMIGK